METDCNDPGHIAASDQAAARCNETLNGIIRQVIQDDHVWEHTHSTGCQISSIAASIEDIPHDALVAMSATALLRLATDTMQQRIGWIQIANVTDSYHECELCDPYYKPATHGVRSTTATLYVCTECFLVVADHQMVEQ